MSASSLKTILPALVPFALAAVFWRVYPELLIDADTPRYLANDPMRTATYPLFLDVAYGPALLQIQLLLFATALCWLTISASRFVPWWIAAFLMFGIGANPYLWQLQATVMSEALTTPILTVVVGCIIAFVFEQRYSFILAASFLTGFATSIRPPFAALLACVLLTAILTPDIKRRLRLLGLIVLAWSLPVVAERGYALATYGNEAGSPLGRHAFMKAAVIDAPAIAPRSSDPLDMLLARSLNHDLEPVRQTISRAPDWQIRYILLTNYEACLAWSCGDRILDGVERPRKEIDGALWHAGTDRIAGNPVGYLQLTLTEYLRMWLLHPRKHPALAERYNAFLDRESPLPFQAQLGVEGQPTPPDEMSDLFRINRLVFAAIGLSAALLTLASALLYRQTSSRVALPLLAGGQAVLILCAFTAVGLPRYAMGMWPVIVAGEFFGFLGMVEAFRAGSDNRRLA